MEDNNQETKALTDLIQNPQEISNIINNPADSGVKFYQSLRNKDKQYVAFAAGLGLIAYGFFLGRGSKKSTSASGQYSGGKKGKNKSGQSQGGASASLDQGTATGAGNGYGGDYTSGNQQGGDFQGGGNQNY